MRNIAFVVLKILCYISEVSYALPRKSADSCDSSTNKTVVDCSRSSLDNVPFVTLGSNSFKVLNLSHNEIKELNADDFSKNLTSLETLDLSFNKIRRLSGHVFSNLKNLKVLNLSHNKVKRINGFAFADLNSLKFLNMDRNVILSLEDGSFHGLINLEILNLNRNKLSSVEAGWLFGLEKLREFYANNNHIARLEKSPWSYTPNLNILDLSKNSIGVLNDASVFGNLNHLKILLLNRNALSRMNKNIFRSLENLLTLDLSQNLLTDALTDANSYLLFENAKSLETLKLNSNDLPTLLNNTFADLKKLNRLELLNNPIVSLPHRFLPEASRLMLIIDFNDFFCDCRSGWLISALKNRRIDVKGVLKCNFPAEFRHTELIRLEGVNLACNQSFSHFNFEFKFVDKLILRNDNFSFECGANFKCPVDDCEILSNWHRGDEILPERSDHYFISTDRNSNRFSTKLSFISARNSSNDKYTCKIVSRKTGHVFSGTGNLIVHSKPIFVKVPSNVTALVGRTIRLDCYATGDPPPQISWRKDDQYGGGDVPAAVERRMHVMPSPDDDAFFISNVRSNDAGLYICAAENLAGRTTAEAYLRVLDPQVEFDEDSVADSQNIAQHSSSSVIFEDRRNFDVENRIHNVIVNEKQSIVLECPPSTNFSSTKDSSYEWTFNGRTLAINDDRSEKNISNKKYHTTSNGRILIALAALKSDSGLYTCKLSSDELNLNTSFMLHVKNASEDEGDDTRRTPPDIFYVIDGRRDVFLSLNEKLTMICSIVAACVCVLLVIIFSFYVRTRRRNERRVNVVLAVENYNNNNSRTIKSSSDLTLIRPLRIGDNSKECATSET